LAKNLPAWPATVAEPGRMPPNLPDRGGGLSREMFPPLLIGPADSLLPGLALWLWWCDMPKG